MDMKKSITYNNGVENIGTFVDGLNSLVKDKKFWWGVHAGLVDRLSEPPGVYIDVCFKFDFWIS